MNILEIRDNPSRLQVLDEREFELAWRDLAELATSLDELERAFIKEYIRRAGIRESKGKQ